MRAHSLLVNLTGIFLNFILNYLFIYFGCARCSLRHAGSLVAACRGFFFFKLRHTGSLVAACKLLVAACGIEFPDQGSNPGPLHWEHGVLATGPPGKSLNRNLNRKKRKSKWPKWLVIEANHNL